MAGQCVTLWVGSRLGAVERACLRSVLRQGHRLALYRYGQVDGVPEGVEVRDAAGVLPESAVFRHRSGSFGLFADWFRYALLKLGAGTWVDTDVYLIHPLPEGDDHLFGEQAPGIINNAVLRLPSGSGILDDLLRPFERGALPVGIGRRAGVAAGVRKLVHGKLDLARLPWGSTGPHALTRAVAERGLGARAEPPQVFYPVPWQKAAWIADPGIGLDDVVGPETVAIHLWNECIKQMKERPAPAGSFLERLHGEGAGR